MTKNPFKKIQKNALGITQASITTGVSASVVSGIGGTSGASGAKALNTLAGYYPTMANVSGGGIAIGMLKSLNPKKKK